MFNDSLTFVYAEDTFNFDIYEKVIHGLLNLNLLFFAVNVHRRILNFIKKQNGRLVDQIIKIHIKFNLFAIPLTLFFLTGLQWSQNLKNYVSNYGCYFGTLLANWHFYYCQSHSFTISFFRFVCILYPDIIARLGLNAPQVRCFINYLTVYRVSNKKTHLAVF